MNDSDPTRDITQSTSHDANAQPVPPQPQPPTGGARVLVIDDEPEIQRAVGARLTGEGFVVAGAPTGTEGLEQVARWRPDVIILDLTLPDIDGVEVCRRLRTWSATPVIVLSVRDNDDDKVAALEAGADDYLTKPFSSRELVARVRVALRHVAGAGDAGQGAAGARFETGGLAIDFARRRVTVDGAEVHLTPTEFEMLKYLARYAGKVITRRTLLLGVWGPQYATEDHYLHVFVGQLRRKLEPNPSRPIYLLTEPGVGYRLRSPA
ncbi:MAG TPA: response regulator transcription factor [Ktedonobacterales bacterium]|nr:response regulator transcription factor [Ktedonobacterales bacterium]